MPTTRYGWTTPTGSSVVRTMWSTITNLANAIDEALFQRGAVISRIIGHVVAGSTVPNNSTPTTIHYYSTGPVVPADARSAVVSMQWSGVANINAQCHWQPYVRIVGVADIQVGSTSHHNNGQPYQNMGMALTVELDVTTYRGYQMLLYVNASNDAASGGPVYVGPMSFQITFKK